MAIATAIISLVLLGLPGLACTRLQSQPKLKKETEATEMYCKGNKEAILFTKDKEEKWFPTEISPACICFIAAGSKPHASIFITEINSSKCKDSK